LAENTDLSKQSLLSKEKVLWRRGQKYYCTILIHYFTIIYS